MTMKVLIPACNMESRLRNKYVFYRTACHSALFVRVCVQGGGWVAGVCPRVRELGVRFRSGGAVCLHTRGARVCVCVRVHVCAPTEVGRLAEGARAAALFIAAAVSPCTSGCVCLFTRPASARLRTPACTNQPPASHPRGLGTGCAR